MPTREMVFDLQKRIGVNLSAFSEAAVSGEQYDKAIFLCKQKQKILIPRADMQKVCLNALAQLNIIPAKRNVVSESTDVILSVFGKEPQFEKLPTDHQFNYAATLNKGIENEVVKLKDCLPQPVRAKVAIEQQDMNRRLSTIPPPPDPNKVAADTFKREVKENAKNMGNAIAEGVKGLPNVIGSAAGGAISGFLSQILPFILIALAFILVVVFLLRGKLPGILKAVRG